MQPKITQAWMRGVILSLICIVYGLILYFTHQAQNKLLGYLQLVIIIGGIIWACVDHAKQMEGNVTFGNVFAHGFKTTAAMAAILAVYTYIAFKFIYPDMIDMSLDEARKGMESKNNMSEEQIKQALEMGRKFFIPFAIGGLILVNAIIGAIASLIGAAVAKKNPGYTPVS